MAEEEERRGLGVLSYTKGTVGEAGAFCPSEHLGLGCCAELRRKATSAMHLQGAEQELRAIPTCHPPSLRKVGARSESLIVIGPLHGLAAVLGRSKSSVQRLKAFRSVLFLCLHRSPFPPLCTTGYEGQVPPRYVSRPCDECRRQLPLVRRS